MNKVNEAQPSSVPSAESRATSELKAALADMNAQPDVSGNDSERLQGFCRMTTVEVKAVGMVSAATSLEMIGYIRELEWKLTQRLSASGVDGQASSLQSSSSSTPRDTEVVASDEDAIAEKVFADWLHRLWVAVRKIPSANCGMETVVQIVERQLGEFHKNDESLGPVSEGLLEAFRGDPRYAASPDEVVAEPICTCFADEAQMEHATYCPREGMDYDESVAESAVVKAYRDAEGWVLFGKNGEPVDWPSGWPTEIDSKFLQQRNIEVGA